MTLGANRLQTALVIFREARFGIMASIIAAFGRVISEVGISMMLGGNIKGFTRTMTTAMALEYDKGSFTLAIALLYWWSGGDPIPALRRGLVGQDAGQPLRRDRLQPWRHPAGWIRAR